MSDLLERLYVLDWHGNVWQLIVRLLIAAICGFLLGLERKKRSKEAGIRTHTIVAIASALMMIVSKYAFLEMGGDGRFDGARIAAQVVTGIGFLGAGMIFYRRDMLHGLTTAAGIWATAGIGLAIGGGMLVIGVVSTLLILIIQLVFHLPFKSLHSQHFTILKAQAILENEETVADLKKKFNITKFIKFRTLQKSEGQITAELEFIASRPYTANELYKIISETPYITLLEKTEEN